MLPRECEEVGGRPRAPMAPWALRASAEPALKQRPNPQRQYESSRVAGRTCYLMETSLGRAARVGPSDGFRVLTVA